MIATGRAPGSPRLAMRVLLVEDDAATAAQH
jgi:hypothetical protein